ncbi:ribonuclease P protein component [Azovibrio restrictus]|uniref:ribonuclease P protein component n=1 Tax=Azovibrio restrictus TaxID=146938 RepID=UPI0026F04BE7|nr:ribonuclease P protein component [Azovibrio restrictus]
MTPGGPRPFPRQYRLTKTDEYSSVFGFRRAIRGRFFLLHHGPPGPAGQPARLGLVIGKKLLKRAVQRNLVKRIARERFRLLHPDLPSRDIVLRLAVKLQKPVRAEVAADIERLFDRLRRAESRSPAADAAPGGS